jgi:RNA polymerase sigma-70 factor (ECF subfamily)
MAEDFVRLMTEHQGRLFGYLYSLLGDADQANEVLQETNVILWRDSQEYRPGSNFKAWAFRVAHFQMMAFRQRQIRDRLVFEDDLIEGLAAGAREADENFEARQKLLDGCLEKLGEPQRDLIRRRYALGESLQSIAERRRMSANAVTQALFRLRQSLMQCVARGAPGAAL